MLDDSELQNTTTTTAAAAAAATAPRTTTVVTTRTTLVLTTATAVPTITVDEPIFQQVKIQLIDKDHHLVPHLHHLQQQPQQHQHQYQQLSNLCKEKCPDVCDDVSHCKKTIRDECDCCSICVRQINETCGSDVGVCDQTLQCRKKERTDATGICVGQFKIFLFSLLNLLFALQTNIKNYTQ